MCVQIIYHMYIDTDIYIYINEKEAHTCNCPGTGGYVFLFRTRSWYGEVL